MAKIAIIGAGSMVFCKTLANDILAMPVLQDSEICLMNHTQPELDRMEAFVGGNGQNNIQIEKEIKIANY